MRLVPPFSGDGGMTCKVAARRVAAAAGSNRWTGGEGGWMDGCGVWVYPYTHIHTSILRLNTTMMLGRGNCRIRA